MSTNTILIRTTSLDNVGIVADAIGLAKGTVVQDGIILSLIHI